MAVKCGPDFQPEWSNGSLLVKEDKSGVLMDLSGFSILNKILF